MNAYLAAAGAVALLVCLVHSVGGELFVLRRLTSDCLPSGTGDARPFRRTVIALFGTTGERGRRLLRVTWHLPVVLGLGLVAILWRLAVPDSPSAHLAFVERATALSFLAAALVALVGTRGKHPGWVGLLGVAVLVWLART